MSHPALAHTEAGVFWLDRPDAPEPAPPLAGAEACDLVVVGGGFTGLWAAVQAKQRTPDLDVVLVEGAAVASGASGRNGGFCSASLTHGALNGVQRFPGDIDRLLKLGHENLAAIAATVADHRIDCAFEATGELTVATEDYQLAELAESARALAALDEEVTVLDRDAVRAELDSPTYRGGLLDTTGTALVDPARLAWGLRRVALELGVRVYEHTPVTTLETRGPGLSAVTPGGRIGAARALLGTSAFPPLAPVIRRYVVPVYDHVLVTEPLSADQRAAIGWAGRRGVGDSANRFHYYRLTEDDRILWGGYDALYYYGNRIDPGLERRPETAELLAGHFFDTFPQLDGLAFTHHWAGVIDTCSRFCLTAGTVLDGRAAYAVGYTGLGVGASRFGAAVGLDLLFDPASPLLELEMVRRRPVPFPPEPLRWAVIQQTRAALARADRRQGRRGPWLRVLDRLGLGFDS